MSELMRPIPFGALMDRALSEYQANGTVFGVHELYRHAAGKTLPIFREKIETPFGPAAGPHTQLAQNLISAYAGGSRFFEVKTVQVMDGADLSACVARPCILARDEGYNVEWSTELTVPQAFAEYAKAFFAIKLLSRELELGAPDGFVFNMSVGYDLAGIRSEKIDRYIEGMRNAAGSEVWEECVSWALENLHRFRRVDRAFVEEISPNICDSITISTLHGCPPDEIERIATYLIGEKHLNTYIKCNPTLLGYDFARATMDGMGYDDLAFDDHHFRKDLQYRDAIPMFRRLLALAAKNAVEFGVKLTNTFPVQITGGQLPGEEMYMSGKSLYPLSISLAEKIEGDFDGKLRVSYSGGADFFNISKIFDCGIWPITLATTLLKTGGYNRLKQIAETLAAKPYAPFSGVDLEKLSALAAQAKTDVHHVKPLKTPPRKKAEGRPPLTDCFLAPCRDSCPIHQDIPAYLQLVSEEKYAEALAVICDKNPLPFITGTLCSHRCQTGCTRSFYEESVHIREMKLRAAENGFSAFLETLRPALPRADGVRVAVVGGGPGGMAAAFFAARAGAKVTIFEQRDSLGGVVRHVIPAFRIADRAIDNDAELLKKLGVEVRLNCRVTSEAELKEQGYTHVILAIGAWKHAPLRLVAGRALNVLDFLETLKKDPGSLSVSGNVAVIGAGNTAMDAARAAKRLPGVERVSIVYRRQIRQMPADLEELALARSEGVEFLELLSPISHENGVLKCQVMALGAPGPDGRRAPVATDAVRELPVDTVISAIGEKADTELLGHFGADALVIGDACRGPATVVEAIADAAAAVKAILPADYPDHDMTAGYDTLRPRRGTLCHSGAFCDGERCLGCSVLCESCVDVCPNRANAVVTVNGREQVFHIDRLCNECGNCAVFCPYEGKPYHDKLTLFSTAEDLENSPENPGFLPLGGGRYRLRLNGDMFEAGLADPRIPGEVAAMIAAIEEDYAELI